MSYRRGLGQAGLPGGGAGYGYDFVITPGQSEHGSRSPEEIAMLLEQSNGKSVAVPNPKGPSWWDVFSQDPVGAIKQATVETFSGSAGAAAAIAQTAGTAAGAAVGSTVNEFFTQLTQGLGGYARVLFFVALGIAALYVAGPIFAGGRR